MTTKLPRRSKSDRIVGGVAAGLGAYGGIGALLIRLCWVLFTLLGGAGVLAYLLAWAIIPDEDGQRSIIANPDRASSAALLFRHRLQSSMALLPFVLGQGAPKLLHGL